MIVNFPHIFCWIETERLFSSVFPGTLDFFRVSMCLCYRFELLFLFLFYYSYFAYFLFKSISFFIEDILFWFYNILFSCFQSPFSFCNFFDISFSTSSSYVAGGNWIRNHYLHVGAWHYFHAVVGAYTIKSYW